MTVGDEESLKNIEPSTVTSRIVAKAKGLTTGDLEEIKGRMRQQGVPPEIVEKSVEELADKSIPPVQEKSQPSSTPLRDRLGVGKTGK